MEPIETREFRSRIGRAIRNLRKEEGISAQFLAKVLDVTQPTISRIENGTTSIAAEKLCFLAKSFNRPLSFFIGEQNPILYDEEDILRAGLVFYGAKHLKCKRIIDIQEYYRTYADFLNAALAEVEDPRFAVALATTLYRQTAEGQLKITKIVSTVTHERLISNFKALIDLIFRAEQDVKRPSRERKQVLSTLKELESAFKKEIPISSVKAILNPKYFNLKLNLFIF